MSANSSTRSTETPEEALARIQSMGFCKNDAIVIMSFADAGIPADDIDPRHNVLTFKAWKAAGRQVAKGAKSVRVTVWIPKKGKKDAPKNGEKKSSGGMYPKTTSLFHISQTIPLGAEKGTRPDAWNNPALVRDGTYEAETTVHPEPPAALASAEALTRAKQEAQRVEYPDHVPLTLFDTDEQPTVDDNGRLQTSLADIHKPAIVREETLELDDNGDLATVSDAVCNCPAIGLVTNVDCPIHGPAARQREMAVTS